MKKFIFDLQRFAHISSSADSTILNGTSDDDSIENGGFWNSDTAASNISIMGYGGDDEIYNRFGKKVTINAGEGNDTIFNYGDNAKIDLAEGDDDVRNFGSYVTITGGDGKDTISSAAFFNTDLLSAEGLDIKNIVMDGGDGDDRVSNSSDNATITGGAGNDAIVNYGSNVTIKAGEGNDNIRILPNTITKGTLYVSGTRYNVNSDNVIVYGDDGDDYITNEGGGENVTIIGGAGNDTFYSSSGANVYLYNVGDGNDVASFGVKDTLVIGGGSYTTAKGSGYDIIVYAGDGSITLNAAMLNKTPIIEGTFEEVKENPEVKDDTKVNVQNGTDNADSISNSTDYTFINAGAGDDTISNRGSNSTISGGAGKDKIDNYANNVTITGDDGEDDINIHINSENVIVYGNEGNDKINNHASNSTVISGAGKDKIDSYGENVIVYAGEDNDSISTGSNSTVLGGDGKDYIYNNGENAIVYGGEDNDTIYNFGSDSTISGGNGRDNLIIFNIVENVLLYGGEGNDTISSSLFDADEVTISGGTGDDRINVKSDGTGAKTFAYNAGDGNDTISNFGEYDTLLIGGGSYTTTKSGNDLIVNIGDGTITLLRMADKNLSIQLNSNLITEIETPSENIAVAETPVDDIGATKTPSENTAVTETPAENTGTADTPTQNFESNNFVYSSGNETINNFNFGDKLNFAATYTNWLTDGADLVINAAEGSVRITDAQNKLIELADANGNLISHVYLANDYEGVIDGRNFGAFEVIKGSDHVNNQIWSDAAGSSMWGGRGGSDDELFGNLGIDEYIYSYGNGHDNIFQSGNEDTLNLLNISLDQIAGAMFTDNGTYFKFTDGGSLNISGQVSTFKVGGQTYAADYQNKSWYAK